MRIGVLALQGGVAEHINHLVKLDCEAVEVRKKEELEDLDGIILPGGESTTIGKLLRKTEIYDTLRHKILGGLPVWGTCAGMILLAKDVDNDNVSHLATMDITVRRNAYGSQIDSFLAEEAIEGICSEKIPLVFIRAPFITSVGEKVEILVKIEDKVVAARQDNMLVTSFHPELTDNLEFHRYFLGICGDYVNL